MLVEPWYNHKVDNWALGVLLFEMLTGESPFYGSHEALLSFFTSLGTD
jgi:serine/threonine protein kinase